MKKYWQCISMITGITEAAIKYANATKIFWLRRNDPRVEFSRQSTITSQKIWDNASHLHCWGKWSWLALNEPANTVIQNWFGPFEFLRASGTDTEELTRTNMDKLMKQSVGGVKAYKGDTRPSIIVFISIIMMNVGLAVYVTYEPFVYRVALHSSSK